jgi:hypothetical protein
MRAIGLSALGLLFVVPALITSVATLIGVVIVTVGQFVPLGTIGP